MKSPAFQFYPADYLADENVQLLSLEQEGAYIRAMAYCWREGTIPSDPAILAILIGKGCTEAIASKIIKLFSQAISEDGHPMARLVHPRLEKERIKQLEYSSTMSESGKKGAEKRWGRNKSSTYTSKPGHSQANGVAIARPMASDSSSSSSTSSSTNIDPLGEDLEKEQKIAIAPRITMTPKEAQSLIAEFGKPSCEYYKSICSDWLVANGKYKKSGAAFMRNWIRKEIAERRGFYYPKKSEVGFRPHTAANTAEKNLKYLEDQYGTEGVKDMLTNALNGEKESRALSVDGGSLVPLAKKST